jgi:hypothetical protein
VIFLAFTTKPSASNNRCTKYEDLITVVFASLTATLPPSFLSCALAGTKFHFEGPPNGVGSQ